MRYAESFPLSEADPLFERNHELEIAIAITGRVRYAVMNWVESFDGEAIKAPDIYPGNMTGACAIVSWMSQRILEKLRINTTLVRGEFDGRVHCWLEVGEVIVDGTATQFGIRDEVYVTLPDLDDRYDPGLYDSDVENEFHITWQAQSPFWFQPELLKIEDRITREMRPRAWRAQLDG